MLAVLFSLLLSVHGARKKTLSPSGVVTAFVVGYGSLSGGLWGFGITLVGFYLAGSWATKYGSQRKAKLEDAHHTAGYRTGWQVLSNSAAGLAATAAWNNMFVPNSPHAWLLGWLVPPAGPVYGEPAWCPLDSTVAGGWSRALVLAAVGHYACCLGDTLATELGILSQGKPRLITTLRPVPPGTNGGISVKGILASITGGALVGVLMGVTLLLENRRCRDTWISMLLSVIGWGAFSGLFGSLLDSLLGATIQQTKFSEAKRVVLQDETAAQGPVSVISGFDILTNNQVNLVSSAVTCVVVGVLSLSLLH